MIQTEFIRNQNNPEIALKRASEVLLAGGIFVFPTDTVYGLGCIYDNEEAVNKIYKLKGRDFRKPLAAYFSSIQMAENYITKQGKLFYDISLKYLPGALTIVVEKNEKIPNFVTSNQNTVGIRIPNHKFILDLINYIEVPFVGTSANISNYPSAKTAQEAFEIFKDQIELVVEDDQSLMGIESTVISIINEDLKILRQGAIKIEF